MMPQLGQHIRSLLVIASLGIGTTFAAQEKPRVIITSDGEIDDECSLVRCLLYANEFDIEGLITTSSQYHWQGHKWAGDDWAQPYLRAYAAVYPNLCKHAAGYPAPELLQARTLLGNVSAEGEMQELTEGAKRIVDVLLDTSDKRPVWIQAWGGTNTLARALKTIEEQYPERMAEVAGKLRFYLIWEQDNTYQKYIRPRWGKFGIPTMISDQFLAFFYNWKNHLPSEQKAYLAGSWMKSRILENHGPLCSLYKAHGKGVKGFEDGDFRSEGDSPAFLHLIPTGLRNMESPAWGGWGGRFVRVRENTWLDPVAEQGYRYPEGRWFTETGWGRTRMRLDIPNDTALTEYLRPQWRWIAAIQNDFAARADWCVKSPKEANHAPRVRLNEPLDRTLKPGESTTLLAPAYDPDGNKLSYKWWQDTEAGTVKAIVPIILGDAPDRASICVPAEPGHQIHIIVEITDDGTPPLTCYQRFVVSII